MEEALSSSKRRCRPSPECVRPTIRAPGFGHKSRPGYFADVVRPLYAAPHLTWLHNAVLASLTGHISVELESCCRTPGSEGLPGAAYLDEDETSAVAGTRAPLLFGASGVTLGSTPLGPSDPDPALSTSAHPQAYHALSASGISWNRDHPIELTIQFHASCRSVPRRRTRPPSKPTRGRRGAGAVRPAQLRTSCQVSRHPGHCHDSAGCCHPVPAPV